MANQENYRLKLTSASQKDIDKLSPKIKVELLERHFTRLVLSPRNYSRRLHGDLKNCFSYHFGHHPEYRILFTIVSDEIVILMIAKRENFYKDAYKRL
ncbi:MAG: hypothetical protein A3B68_05655 [Candidatus Melainabacteria bacterium RIFCSPHIGHO2_02_FULL_34_12]|nr:MAG: hypothetical protein A3B68_05655 [Candidatus Melainabacteria bacterium RIFCSPHIGHO2_02_FULL_34_12]